MHVVPEDVDGSADGDRALAMRRGAGRGLSCSEGVDGVAAGTGGRGGEVVEGWPDGAAAILLEVAGVGCGYWI